MLPVPITKKNLGLLDHVDSHDNELFLSIWYRGQVLPSSTLSNVREVDLIYEGYKYMIEVTRQGPNSYHLCMNESTAEADIHRMPDGGLLISYDGSSYTSYMKEQVDR